MYRKPVSFLSKYLYGCNKPATPILSTLPKLFDGLILQTNWIILDSLITNDSSLKAIWLVPRSTCYIFQINERGIELQDFSPGYNNGMNIQIRTNRTSYRYCMSFRPFNNIMHNLRCWYLWDVKLIMNVWCPMWYNNKYEEQLHHTV